MTNWLPVEYRSVHPWSCGGSKSRGQHFSMENFSPTDHHPLQKRGVITFGTHQNVWTHRCCHTVTRGVMTVSDGGSIGWGRLVLDPCCLAHPERWMLQVSGSSTITQSHVLFFNVFTQAPSIILTTNHETTITMDNTHGEQWCRT